MNYESIIEAKIKCIELTALTSICTGISFCLIAGALLAIAIIRNLYEKELWLISCGFLYLIGIIILGSGAFQKYNSRLIAESSITVYHK